MIESQASLFDKGSEGNDLESRIEETKKELWTKRAWIALPRFLESQRRGRDRNNNVIKRLRALKKTGFPVDANYAEMSPQKRWNLLVMSYRPQIYREAGKYCPEVVREISRQNKDAIDTKERAYLLR
ncbi:MAG: hypothetical protein Q8P79_02640 [Nanoarchaeota archaeon]|nr:hypothetical protein [Nanoarchaeota archaeon]